MSDKTEIKIIRGMAADGTAEIIGSDWVSDNEALARLLSALCPIPDGYFPSEYDKHRAALERASEWFPELEVVSMVERQPRENAPAGTIF